ncbi:MAG: zinc ribbon domain-containing protein [Clostridiales bacterium]|jgi:hypothetical protein|nr:zinc ribbon domain-containing protein [Clostridiales bacterium]
MAAFCPNCGAKVSGGFCNDCGTPVSAPAPAASGEPTVTGGDAPKKSGMGFFIIGGGAAVVFAFFAVVVIIVVVLFSGNDIVGIWEEPGSSSWIYRAEFKRNGRGQLMEVNRETDLTRDDAEFRWEVHEGMVDLLVMEIVYTDYPGESEIIVMEYEVFKNAVGTQVLRIRETYDIGTDFWEENFTRAR